MKALCYALLLLNSLGLALATTVESHCLDSEHVYFSCQIDGSTKVVSLCGGIHDGKPSWLQYRFGAIESLELIYPKTTKKSLQQFAGFFQSHKAGPLRIREIWFQIGIYRYRIDHLYSGLPEGDPPCSEKPCIDNTLYVYDGKRMVYLQNCSSEVTNNLWQLEGHISNDQTDR